MAKKVYTIGLAKIETGNIAADGGMGTSLEQLGYTYQDTCTMTQDDPETNDFYAEEVDDPVKSFSKAGKIVLSYQLMNPSPEAMVTLMGGTASKSNPSLADNDTWNAPDAQPQIEKSVRITPAIGYIIEIPRAKITAKIDAQFQKSGMFVIQVTATVLTPEKEGVSKLKTIAQTEDSDSGEDLGDPEIYFGAVTAADNVDVADMSNLTSNISPAHMSRLTGGKLGFSYNPGQKYIVLYDATKVTPQSGKMVSDGVTTTISDFTDTETFHSDSVTINGTAYTSFEPLTALGATNPASIEVTFATV